MLCPRLKSANSACVSRARGVRGAGLKVCFKRADTDTDRQQQAPPLRGPFSDSRDSGRAEPAHTAILQDLSGLDLDIMQASKSLDEAWQRAMDSAADHARESIGWMRHALQDPDDFTANAIGRMVSKEYGKHERPHTEHHLWRIGAAPHSTAAPLGSSPRASADGAHQPPQQQQHAQQQHQQAAAPGSFGRGWLAGVYGGAAQGAAWDAPPSGPGFLRKQTDAGCE